MSRDVVARENRLHLISRLRFVEGLTETEIEARLADEGLHVSRSTISRDISRARARFEDEVGARFNPRAVLGQAVAQLDSIIFDSLRSAQTASNSGRAALYRVAAGAITEKVRVLTEAGLLTRAALIVNVRADEAIPDGRAWAAIMRDAQVSESELISEAERATRYGEPPLQG